LVEVVVASFFLWRPDSVHCGNFLNRQILCLSVVPPSPTTKRGRRRCVTIAVALSPAPACLSCETGGMFVESSRYSCLSLRLRPSGGFNPLVWSRPGIYSAHLAEEPEVLECRNSLLHFSYKRDEYSCVLISVLSLSGGLPLAALRSFFLPAPFSPPWSPPDVLHRYDSGVWAPDPDLLRRDRSRPFLYRSKRLFPSLLPPFGIQTALRIHPPPFPAAIGFSAADVVLRRSLATWFLGSLVDGLYKPLNRCLLSCLRARVPRRSR